MPKSKTPEQILENMKKCVPGAFHGVEEIDSEAVDGYMLVEISSAQEIDQCYFRIEAIGKSSNLQHYVSGQSRSEINTLEKKIQFEENVISKNYEHLTESQKSSVQKVKDALNEFQRKCEAELELARPSSLKAESSEIGGVPKQTEPPSEAIAASASFHTQDPDRKPSLSEQQKKGSTPAQKRSSDPWRDIDAAKERHEEHVKKYAAYGLVFVNSLGEAFDPERLASSGGGSQSSPKGGSFLSGSVLI